MNNSQVHGNLHSSSNPQSLSDQTLYQLCRTYGARALEWRRKFTGLLPEVFRRKLYEKKGFPSIFVFAKKLAGLSEQQVRLALNLEKRFENFPILLALLVNGEVSVNKLVRIASIVNSENEEFLANQLKILSSGAIEILVRDEKWANSEKYAQKFIGSDKNQNGLLQPISEGKSLHMQTFLQSNYIESNAQIRQSSQTLPTKSIIHPNGQTLNLSTEVQQKLLELQQKGFDVNQLILDLLEKREEGIAERKKKISEEVLQREDARAQLKEENANQIAEEVLQSALNGKWQGGVAVQSRPYIIKAVRQILHDEHGTKCSIKNCQKLAETIHHTQRFALSGSHDPHYLAPLCKEHHEIAHAVDVRCQEMKKRWVRM